MIDTAVLISIKPKWVNLILSGKKTIEVRKTVPKLPPPFTCYIYESGTGCVVGEFVCDWFIPLLHPSMWGEPGKAVYDMSKEALDAACITTQELLDYANGGEAFGWRISSVKEYETPLPLSEFKRPCMTPDKSCYECQLWNNGRYEIPGCALANIEKPPQSWRYVMRRCKQKANGQWGYV